MRYACHPLALSDVMETPMRKAYPLFAGILALALCGATPSHAQPTGAKKDDKMSKEEREKKRKEWERMFREHDKNKDGGLQKNEVGDKAFPNIRDHFPEMDTNNDGKVTIAEHDAWEKKHREDERAAKKK
jgi:hypothetical protein